MNSPNYSWDIIITWMPWSGKSCICKKLHKELWYDLCDFDDDVLEKITLETAEEVLWVLNLRSTWLIPENLSHKEVKDLLELLWEDVFLKLEWFMWRNLVFKNPTVLSTSGSLPMRLDAMNHLKQNWKVIYIDIPIEIIISRLGEMKKDRIIWIQKMTLEEILRYRANFYQFTKDFNFKTPLFEARTGKTKEERDKEKEIVFWEFMEFYNSEVLWIK